MGEIVGISGRLVDTTTDADGTTTTVKNHYTVGS
jgi:hypothetical protein